MKKKSKTTTATTTREIRKAEKLHEIAIEPNKKHIASIYICAIWSNDYSSSSYLFISVLLLLKEK